MHTKVKEDLNTALKTIESNLREKFPKDYSVKYKSVLTELAKVRHDDSDNKGYKYFVDEVYWSVKDITNIPRENTEWQDSLATIGLLLNATDRLYEQIECSPNDEAEDVYHYLIDLIGSTET